MQTINKTNTVSAAKLKRTPEADYPRLMKRAGAAKYDMMQGVYLKDDPAYKYKQVYAGLNGVDFYFVMGETANMPEPVYAILLEAGKVAGGTKAAAKDEPKNA